MGNGGEPGVGSLEEAWPDHSYLKVLPRAASTALHVVSKRSPSTRKEQTEEAPPDVQRPSKPLVQASLRARVGSEGHRRRAWPGCGTDSLWSPFRIPPLVVLLTHQAVAGGEPPGTSLCLSC